jgi:AraC-like DNA-binding protein
MKYAFLIAAFNAFFFTGLLFQKKPRGLHDNILIAWLIYLGLFIGVYAIYSHELFTRFLLLSVSLVSLLMLHGPFLYTYVLTLVTGRTRPAGRDFIHLIPFVLFNAYILAASFNSGLATELDLEKVTPGRHTPLLFSFFLVMTALSGTIYFLFTLRLFRNLDRNISNNFSNIEGVDPHWIRILTIAFGVIWTVLITITVIHHIFGLFSAAFCTDGLFLTLSVFVILVGWFGLRQKVIFPYGNMFIGAGPEAPRQKYSGSRLSGDDSKEYADRIREYMAGSKPYLEPELSLPQLADDLDIPSHYLSRVINEQFGQNFHDFINGYRVDAFRERMSTGGSENLTLLGIAFECGFNSKSAFNRVFRQFTGMTPSQYKNNL